MGRHDDRRRSAFDREFLEHERVRDVIEAGAAVLFGQKDAEHAEPRELVDGCTGILMRAVGLDADWPELLAGEAAGNVARAALRIGEFEIHLDPYVA